MSQKALQLFPLVESLKNTVSCLTTLGDKLLVGTTEGTLLVFNIEFDQNDKRKFICNLSFDETIKSFSRKPIHQLCVIKDLNQLISISGDENIKIHSLDNFKEMQSLAGRKGAIVKGCNLFAVKKQKGIYMLGATAKKRLYVFRLNPSESKYWTFVEEYALPDTPRCITWSGEWLCLGYKKQYTLIHATEAKSKILFSGNVQNSTLCMAMPKSKEVIVVRDGIGICLDFDGHPARSYGLQWGEVPSCMGFLNPYIIVGLQNNVEIHLLRESENGTLIQSIPIPGITKISHDNYLDMDKEEEKEERNELKHSELDIHNRIFIAGLHKLYVLCMRYFEAQVNTLLQNKQYKDALDLCEILKDTRFKLPDHSVESIYLEYAFYLMARGDFKKAMSYFANTNVDPRFVISQIPNLLNSSMNSFMHMETERIKNLLSDEIKYKEALKAIIPFLTHRRIPAEKKDLTETEKEISEAVDTAMLKAYLATCEQLVHAFVRMPNRCNVTETEEALKEAKKYYELITFYKSKGMHEQSLELLKRLSNSSESEQLQGIQPTIDYLSEIKDDDLLLKYAGWVLLKEPMNGLKIFDKSNLPAEEILEYFDTLKLSDATKLQMKIAFLENIVKKSQEPETHNQLILLYLQIIRQNAVEESIKDSIRPKLKEFLIKSQYYTPEKLLSKLPFDEMYEERAILLSRINRHAQALSIYVHKMKRPDLAEKYCSQIYGTNNEESKNIFITLVQLYLNPPNGEEVNIPQAIKTLENNYEKINSIQALRLLPPDIPVQMLANYYDKLFKKFTERRRDLQVIKNLMKSENLQIQAEYIKDRSKVMCIKPNRRCPVCKRKIENKVFRWYPNGTVCHYICWKDNHVDPKTGRNFLLEYKLFKGKYPSKR